TSPIFAYGPPPKPVEPSPGLREKFEAEDRRQREREAERIAQHERVLAMTPDERKAWVAEQRRKLAERKRLRELDPEQRRECIRRVGGQSGERLVHRRNDDGRVSSHGDDADEVIFGRTIERPPVDSTQRTSDRSRRGERMGGHGSGGASGFNGDDLHRINRADGTSGEISPYYDGASPGDDGGRPLDDELAEAIAWNIGHEVAQERHARQDEVAKLRKQIDRLENQVDMLMRLIGNGERAIGRRRSRDAA